MVTIEIDRFGQSAVDNKTRNISKICRPEADARESGTTDTLLPLANDSYPANNLARLISPNVKGCRMPALNRRPTGYRNHCWAGVGQASRDETA